MQLTREDIAFGSPLHAKLIARIASRMKLAEQEQSNQHERWKDAEERVLAYVPANEADTRRETRRDRGEPQYTTIQLPYTFAVLMTFHTYITSVFFGRSPVHQFAGRHGETEMQVQAMEALISYQVEVGRMLAPYYLWFYDGGKYGVGWIGSYWDEDIIQFTNITRQPSDPNDPQSPQQKVQTSQRVRRYAGNRIYNISPYDAFPDPRVSVGNFQQGEFFGVRQRVPWHKVKKREAMGLYTNVDRITADSSGRVGETGSGQLERPREDWQVNKDENTKHPAVVVLREVYVELTQSEWDLGESDWPEKWVFTVTEDMKTLLGAQPLGCAHGEFPIDVFEPEIEAYGVYNRSLPEILQPLQQTMDWLVNSHFYNVRATLNNQFIIDPTKIVMKDVKKGGPGFVFRMKPEAFGQDIDKMFKQVAVQDVTRQNMGDLAQLFGIGERVFGVTDQMMGMLAQGGRKSATEVRTSTGFGVNRQKTISEYASATSFSPHAEKLVSNSQQYYDTALKLRIVGDLALDAGPRFMMVSPDDIAGKFDLVAVDGTLPIDRFAQVTLWNEMLSQLGPAGLLQGFDVTRIIAWVMGLAGVKNTRQFRLQVQPDAALAAQAQQGNVVPLRPGAGTATSGASGASTAARPPQPPMLNGQGNPNGAY